MERKKREFSLAFWIFIGLVAGIAVGLVLIGLPDIAADYVAPWGTLFLNLIKFIVVPIVLFSITAGIISLKDIRKVGSIGGKVIVFYLCTTAFVIVIGLTVSHLFKGAYKLLTSGEYVYQAVAIPGFIDNIVGYSLLI